jgi:very-short-patch-repair endonuclease
MKTNMHQRASSHLFGFAKSLRRNPTKAEEILWERLRGNQTGYKFRRQHPMMNFVVDFYSHQLRMVIEVDGEIHLGKFNQLEDESKDLNLEAAGYYVIRFTNHQVLNNIEEVMEEIYHFIQYVVHLQLQNKEDY